MNRTIPVQLFARVRELAGKDLQELSISENASLADVRGLLAREIPHARELIQRSTLALNGEYATDDSAIPVGAELALIPPVSGGTWSA